MIRHEDIDDGSFFSKPHKVWCCPSCCIPCNCAFGTCRKAVSGSKKRYKKDGFDVDLAYVTPRIIVHGFPATGLEHFYRNPRWEIRRFMDKYHADHYQTYNFCCEPGRGYDPATFHGRVERYPFKDHHTPPLLTMTAFANSAQAWLEADPANVVNMHCKAGKGRAGLMCCVLLVRSGAAPSALAAMDLYDENRVTNRKGLTVTSQRKFVIFYERLWREVWGVQGNIGDVTAAEEKARFTLPVEPKRRLVQIELMNVPKQFANQIAKYQVKVDHITNFGPQSRHASGKKDRASKANDGDAVTSFLIEDCDVEIEGNFKVFIGFKKAGLLNGFMRLVELQHNTFFMSTTADVIDFGLDQLDVKKKVKPHLGKDVILRLRFGPLSAPSSASALVTVPDGTQHPTGYHALGAADEEQQVSIQMVNLAEKN